MRQNNARKIANVDYIMNPFYVICIVMLYMYIVLATYCWLVQKVAQWSTLYEKLSAMFLIQQEPINFTLS